ncbi:MAG TPA: inactive transglutaminase family protein [Candidatus Saccharimonadia bacterium]|nr:inactive transglutaminase family protein [Candidatus Saccharimonadia bacterium]
MKKTQLYLLALAIAALGIAAFFYKWQVLRFPLAPVAETEVWEIQARIEYQGRGGPNKVTLQLPSDPPGYAILDENFVARGYGVTVEKTKTGREVQWAIRRASGTQALYYRATVYRDDHEPLREPTPPNPPKPTPHEEPYATARQTLLDAVREVTVDSATFAAELVRRLNAANPSEEAELVLGKADGAEERAQLARSLLADRMINARVLHGIELAESQSDAKLEPYLQVYDTEAQTWHTVNARTGSIGWPEQMLIWTTSQRPLLEIDRNRRAELEFATMRSLADALDTAKQRLESKDKDLVAYSLLNLPLQVQGVYRILLMVPLGAFIMLILRNIVGIKTFGTFMPVLIALAFRETQLVAGILLFTLVVSMGLLVRFYLERLRLLLVPRLTAVLILVVLLMALVSVVSNKLGIEIGLSVALFPMIIMTMTIERMSVAWEERGPAHAIREAVGSLIIASLAYLVMTWERVEHLVFVFPELLLVLFAITLLIGRYSGYRLVELFRFRALARDPIGPQPGMQAAPAAGTGG